MNTQTVEQYNGYIVNLFAYIHQKMLQVNADT